MGETRVDLLHLLQDLADAYPADLRRFHDLASSTKTRGQGIGFAGVGIKLGLLVSDEVVTESRRGKEHVSTTWMLTNRRRAPWRWIPPAGLVAERGTAVRLRLSSALSPLVDSGFLEAAVRRHFEPLLDPFFDDLLRKHYPNGARFEINGRELARDAADRQLAPIAVRLVGKRKPSATGYVVRSDERLDEDRRGIAISTFGKVIKRGWDWLGMMPAVADRVSGLIEAPDLAASLTLNKADFLRSGPRGATFLAYRKAMQEAVSARLAEWGDAERADETQRRRVGRPIERDMESVLAELADEFPLLAMLVKRTAGGKHTLRVGRGRGAGIDPVTMDMFSAPPVQPEAEAARPESVAPETSPATPEAEVAAEPPSIPEERTLPEVAVPGADGRRRPTRLGLSIQFESRPDDPELGRLVDTTIWVNEAHPAYRRAAASRAEGYHVALAVAFALGKVAVDSAREREFMLEFLARWGEAREGSRPRKRRRRTRGT